MTDAARAIDWDGERETAFHHVALPVEAAVAAPWGVAAASADSPARRLHARLVETFDASPPRAERKLPVGARLLAIGIAVLLPWIAIGVAAAAFI